MEFTPEELRKNKVTAMRWRHMERDGYGRHLEEYIYCEYENQVPEGGSGRMIVGALDEMIKTYKDVKDQLSFARKVRRLMRLHPDDDNEQLLKLNNDLFDQPDWDFIDPLAWIEEKCEQLGIAKKAPESDKNVELFHVNPELNTNQTIEFLYKRLSEMGCIDCSFVQFQRHFEISDSQFELLDWFETEVLLVLLIDKLLRYEKSRIKIFLNSTPENLIPVHFIKAKKSPKKQFKAKQINTVVGKIENERSVKKHGFIQDLIDEIRSFQA